MKNIYLIGIILNIALASMLFASGETVVLIDSKKQLKKIVSEPVQQGSIHLIIEGLKFREKELDLLLKSSIIKQVTKISIEAAKINVKILFLLLMNIPNQQLTEVHLANLNLKSHGTINMASYQWSQRIKIFTMLNTPINKTFFKNFTTSTFPKLEKLALINCQLKKDFIVNFKKSRLITQLVEMDLSRNKFENDIFQIFEGAGNGHLKILKLNELAFKILGKGKKNGYPVLTQKIITKKNSYVNWESAIFDSLEHLEIQYIEKNPTALSSLLDEPFFQQLSVFLPPFYKKGNLRELKSKPVEVDVFYKKALSKPLISKRNNIKVSSFKLLKNIYDSPQKNYWENIILYGKKWNNVSIRIMLEQQKFPNLKLISLTNTSLTQGEIYHLIKDFTLYNFDVVLSDMVESGVYTKTFINDFDPEYWPRFYDEDMSRGY